MRGLAGLVSGVTVPLAGRRLLSSFWTLKQFLTISDILGLSKSSTLLQKDGEGRQGGRAGSLSLALWP